MKKPTKTPKSGPAVPPAPEPTAGYTTQDYGVVKRLFASGITAVNSYGSPMTWVYAPDDQPRINAVLGSGT